MREAAAQARRLRLIAGSISVKGEDVKAMAVLLQGLEELERALTAREQGEREEI